VARPGTFQKGRSGNPGGRPKAIKAVEDVAREHTPLAMRTLADICADAAAPAAARVATATSLLDRAWGKPIARNLNANVGDVRHLSDAELAAIAAGARPGPDEAEDAAAEDAPEPGSVH
jgi:hypothetical protein